MIKKLIIMGILMIPFLVLTKVATAQQLTYEMMPEEVQAQMDLNKLNGADAWENINVTYTVSPLGLEQTEHAVLLDRKNNYTDIIAIEFKFDGNVEVVCKGGTNSDIIKKLFSELVTGINSIDNKSYIAKK